MNRLEIIDFDRTIGRVEVFTEGVIHSLVEHEHISKVQQSEIREALLHPDTVDFVSLIDTYGIKSELVYDAAQKVEIEPVYEDVRPFMARLDNVWIITSAKNKQLQDAKLKRTGFAGIATVVVGNKGDFIRAHTTRAENGLFVFHPFDSRQGFDVIRVIDDRFEQIEPLVGVAGFDPILLQRPDAKYRAAPHQMAQITVINSLAELA